jgi:hypothetical protein
MTTEPAKYIELYDETKAKEVEVCLKEMQTEKHIGIQEILKLQTLILAKTAEQTKPFRKPKKINENETENATKKDENE